MCTKWFDGIHDKSGDWRNDTTTKNFSRMQGKLFIDEVLIVQVLRCFSEAFE